MSSRRLLTTLVVALLAAGATLGATTPASGAAGGAHPQQSVAPGLYLVTLTAPPAAAYTGSVEGYAATRPAPGARFDSRRRSVTRYRTLLRAQQDDVLADVGRPAPLYRYTTALNGFAARLTTAQVKALRTHPVVARVERNARHRLATVDTARSLGLDGPRGLWGRHGGAAAAGAGIVVGVVDSGIWPENPSFADLPATPQDLHDLDGFTGACARGEGWTGDDCNNKVVAARYFAKAFGTRDLAGSDYLSPRDGRGHGSHTAAIAAGNHDVEVRIERERVGTASGVAPAARLAVYKACWTAPDPADDGCATADAVAAIDQAVADGVDVLNHSIQSPAETTTVTGAVQTAFRGAASAGVVVVAPAGNDGRPGSVSHPAPWAATVGASVDEMPRGAVRLGDGTALVGAMASDESRRRVRLLLGDSAAAPGADPGRSRQCHSGSLDARRVSGAIVVCERGGNARLDKSAAVARAGGVGMVLVNVERGDRAADHHSVPTVHLGRQAGGRLRAHALVAGDAATAALDPTAGAPVDLPALAPFSSRGPTAAVHGGLLKPDLTAPGVGVVAAVAPPSNGGRLWDSYSGTSMAAPHVSGLAALVLSTRPRWSPAAVKSALTTTADDLVGDPGPFAQGAGTVDPAGMLDPGLVYDSGPADWQAFLTGQRATPAGSDSGRGIRARDLNLASIAVGSFTGRARVERTVTNVGRRAETYSASTRGLRGLAVAVRPQVVTLSPGESATFAVLLTATKTADYGAYATGSLTWRGSRGHRVGSPVVARPVTARAPRRVQGTGGSGSVRVSGRSGIDGDIDLTTSGLVSGTSQRLRLVDAPGHASVAAGPPGGPGTELSTYTVPPDTVAARFELRSADAGDDVDLYVYRGAELVASSTRPSRRARVTLDAPPAGRYRVYSQADTAADGVAADAELTGWVVPGEDRRRTDPDDAADHGDRADLVLDADPVAATSGEPFTFTGRWSGLDSDRRWFGVIGYDSSDVRTYVSVN